MMHYRTVSIFTVTAFVVGVLTGTQLRDSKMKCPSCPDAIAAEIPDAGQPDTDWPHASVNYACSSAQRVEVNADASLCEAHTKGAYQGQYCYEVAVMHLCTHR